MHVSEQQGIVRYNRAADIAKLQPLAQNSKSLIAATIPSVGGGSEGFVDLECSSESAFDEHTKDVLVALAELVALERGLSSRSEAEAARRETERLSSTAKECAHYIRNSVHILRSSFGLLREASVATKTTKELQVLTAKVDEHLKHEGACDEIEDVLMQMAAIGERFEPSFADSDLSQLIEPRKSSYQSLSKRAGVRLKFGNVSSRSIPVKVDSKLPRLAH